MIAAGRTQIGQLRSSTSRVVLLVIVWTVPTAGLLISSLRDKDLLSVSGWWTALTTTEQNLIGRAAPPETQVEEDGKLLHPRQRVRGRRQRYRQRLRHADRRTRTSSRPARPPSCRTAARSRSRPTAPTRSSPTPRSKARAASASSIIAALPPKFTLDNYMEVLSTAGIGQSFINSLTVTIPATIIPILIAAYAAYALAWMRFPGRALILSLVVGLLVVPLQMSLIPLLGSTTTSACSSACRQDLSRHLARAHRLRPAARDLSPAQLHGRPAARGHGIGAHRRRQRLQDFHQDRAAAVASRRSPPSRSSSSSGCGTTCSSPWSSSARRTTSSC